MSRLKRPVRLPLRYDGDSYTYSAEQIAIAASSLQRWVQSMSEGDIIKALAMTSIPMRGGIQRPVWSRMDCGSPRFQTRSAPHRRHFNRAAIGIRPQDVIDPPKLVRAVGVEPTTSRLRAGRYCHVELRARILATDEGS